VTSTNTTVMRTIVNLLDEMVPGYRARVNPEDDLVRDLHIDSNDLLSYFVPEIERRLDVKIPIDEWPTVSAIREIANLVSRYAVVSENYCLVCGYDLGFPPWKGGSASDEICPCCGIQFGYHDVAAEGRTMVYRDWRYRWVSGGCSWWSKLGPPQGWNPLEQLKRVNA
jgi:acyl carrier protein